MSDISSGQAPLRNPGAAGPDDVRWWAMIPAWVEGRLQPAEKLEVHRRGLRHKAVSVFLTRGDEVLLQRRAAGKYHSAGMWANTCCTHPHWDEAPGDCARRRLREELGIEGIALKAEMQIEYRAPVEPALIEHEVVDLFFGEAPDGLQVRPAPEEVSETRWVRWDALHRQVAAEPGRFVPWLAIYLAKCPATMRPVA